MPSPSSLAHPRPGAGAGLLGTAAAQNRRGSGSRSLRGEPAVSKTRWGLAGLLAARAPCAEHIVGFRSMAGCSGGTRHPSFSVSLPGLAVKARMVLLKRRLPFLINVHFPHSQSSAGPWRSAFPVRIPG